MQPPALPVTSSGTPSYIAWHATRTPDAPAIVEDDVVITYRTLATDLIRCVHAVEAMGIEAGMLVGVEWPRRYEHVLLLLACEVIGAATTSAVAPGQDNFLTRRCDRLLVNGPIAAANQAKAIVLPPDFASGLVAPSIYDLTELEREVEPERMARIVTTSGTTGDQKAMALSFAVMWLRISRSIDRLPADIMPRPRMLCLYPVGLGGIHVRVLGTLRLGGTVVFGVGDHAAALIASGAVNHLLLTAGDLERLMLRAEAPPSGHPLHVLVFGAAASSSLRQQVREKLNASIANPYAASETNPIAMMGDDDVGTLCPGVEVQIVDETGRELPNGEAGIIRCRSDTMVHGYLNGDAMTKAAFIDGWYQTGDLGFVPEPGRLVVLGRADDMLNIGGVKLAPSPIEAQLKLVDGVSDAAVMSIASANAVGILVAAVEVDISPPPLDAMQRVGAILSCYIGTFVIMPMRWFPRTESGKIKRHDIEAAFRQRQPHELIAVR